jgi:hypothetical protein
MTLPISSTYTLPLSEAALTAFLDEGTIPHTPLERAALFAAAISLRSRQSHASLSALVAQARTLFLIQNAPADEQLKGMRAGMPGTLQACHEALTEQDVDLAPEHVLRRHAQYDEFDAEAFQRDAHATLSPHTILFYTEDARRDAAEGVEETPRAPIHVRRDHDYTDDQARALRAIVANDDEHIDLDAYAGTGKTHLVLQLLAGATRRFTYLAPRPSQVQAFRDRLGTVASVKVISQIAFANDVAADAHRRGMLRTEFRPAYQVSRLSLADIATRIGVQSVGRYPPASVLRIAFEGIARWCRSSSAELRPRHFLGAIPFALLDAERFFPATEHVWRCMFDPAIQKARLLSLSADHIGKWLVQNGAGVSSRWGTLLVDEAHDLSGAWKQLLSAYEGAVISFGDPNQRLVGRAPRFKTGMSLEIVQSVRQGRHVEALVNSALSLDPTFTYQQPFAGSLVHPTLTRTYHRWEDVPLEGTRVYGNAWRLLEEAQRLAASGAAFGIHPDSLTTLGREVQRGAQAHRELVVRGGGSERWEALVAECDEQQLPRIPRMFMRGYDRDHFAEMGKRLQPHVQTPLLLTLVEHTKNTEYGQVAMAPCCFRTGFARPFAHNPVRAAYTAITRGSRELWLPDGALEDLGGSVRRYLEEQAKARLNRVAHPQRAPRTLR